MASVALSFSSTQCVEYEYNKLVESWSMDLKNMDQKGLVLQWSRLMDRYLDQQWSDSHNILYNAQCSAIESAQMTASASLRMMQRSIDARQEMIDMLYQLHSVPNQHWMSGNHSTEGVVEDAKKYTVLPSSDDETQAPIENMISDVTPCTSIDQDAFCFMVQSEPRAVCVEKEKLQSSQSIGTAKSRPFSPRLLAPSPSTPTFSTTCETVTCRNNFTPLCNYNSYWQESIIRESEATRWTLASQKCLGSGTLNLADECTKSELKCRKLDGWSTCALCQERLSLKKSFSADDVENMKTLGSNTTSSICSSLLDFPMPVDIQNIEEEDKLLEMQLNRMAIDHIKSIRCSSLLRDESSVSVYDLREASLVKQSPVIFSVSQDEETFQSATLLSGKLHQNPSLKTAAKKQNFMFRTLSLKKVSSFTKLFAAKKSTSITTTSP